MQGNCPNLVTTLGPKVGASESEERMLAALLHKGSSHILERLSIVGVLQMKRRLLRVEPRGFEPLTSAVQMLAHRFSLVSGR